MTDGAPLLLQGPGGSSALIEPGAGGTVHRLRLCPAAGTPAEEIHVG